VGEVGYGWDWCVRVRVREVGSGLGIEGESEGHGKGEGHSEVEGKTIHRTHPSAQTIQRIVQCYDLVLRISATTLV
jgi:hypothetical protein